ncbi:unnamed protein product [Phaeothamnion confervicola]
MCHFGVRSRLAPRTEQKNEAGPRTTAKGAAMEPITSHHIDRVDWNKLRLCGFRRPQDPDPCVALHKTRPGIAAGRKPGGRERSFLFCGRLKAYITRGIEQIIDGPAAFWYFKL